MRAKILGWLAGALALALSIGAAIFGMRKSQATKAAKIEGEAREKDALTAHERAEWKATIENTDHGLENMKSKSDDEVWESLHQKGKLKG